jgi:hypothetical protein
MHIPNRQALLVRVTDLIEVAADPHPILGTPCWHWRGRINRNGYGRIYWKGLEPVAHRLVYTLLVGPIPDGLILDHLCKCRHCVQPEHLEPVTHQINTRRGHAVLFKPLDRAAGSSLTDCMPA